MVVWNQFDAIQAHFPGTPLYDERDLWAYRYQFMPTIPVPLGERWNWVNRLDLSVVSVPLKSEVGKLFQFDPGNNLLPEGHLPAGFDPFGRTTGLGDLAYLGLVGPKHLPKIGDGKLAGAASASYGWMRGCGSWDSNRTIKRRTWMAKISPTQRTLQFCRKHGWLAGVTERWNHHVGIRQDLFGFIDLIVERNGRLLAIQTTSGSNGSARVKKITTECGVAAKRLLLAGMEIEVWAWRQLKRKVGRCSWQARFTPVTLEDVLAAEPLADEVLDRVQEEQT